MKAMLSILLLMLATATSAQQPAPAIGSVAEMGPSKPVPVPKTIIGQTLDDFRASDFYRFFALVQTGEESVSPPAPYTKATHFGTTGRFKDVMSIVVGTDAAGTIRFAGLTLRRDFVDDPKTSRFARDLAKSFLVISPAFASKEVGGLAAEIWHGCNPGAQDYAVDATGKLAPKACAADTAPSKAYEVYLGQRDALGIAYQGSLVKLSNLRQPGAPAVLLIMFGPYPQQ